MAVRPMMAVALSCGRRAEDTEHPVHRRHRAAVATPRLEPRDSSGARALSLALAGQALGERVKSVRITRRLTESPACLVRDQFDMSLDLERLLLPPAGPRDPAA
jgi:hypothetical protein